MSHPLAPRSNDPPITRREALAASAAGLLALHAGCTSRPAPVEEKRAADAPMRFPGKVPLRVINTRPPCLETPWSYFQHDLTPNEAFYVRWHLAQVPTTIDLRTWRLKLVGNVAKPAEYALDDLKKLPATEVVAVNQCSGNSRGMFTPRIPGAQWYNGGMGNARWKGVRLGELLDRAGLKAGSVEVGFLGMDRGGMPTIPEFEKTLPLDEARGAEVLLAYEMNGEPLPVLNGFPVRLVVPGWFATYWVKAIERIAVLDKPFTGYWMNTAYRIPTTENAVEEPGNLCKTTTPITRMNVRSFFTAPAPGAGVRVGQPVDLSGIAFDGGSGIKRVEVSTDNGQTWQPAALGNDLGRYSFRRWSMSYRPSAAGSQDITGARRPMAARRTADQGWLEPGRLHAQQ
ncbi:MAG: molybdopterin-dependent oxidoreductase [Gemmataceae bacterium]